MIHYLLKLYITGQNQLSQMAVENLTRLCEEELDGSYTLDVIDILESPHLAEEARVLATPTVIKTEPPPTRWVVGNLSNRESVLLGLNLKRRVIPN